MLTDHITFTQVHEIEEDIQKNISIVILQRGFQYHRSGYVYNVEVNPSHVITASVQGSRVYQVSLDLDDFSQSTCTCPYDDYCKHIAATYFYVYSHFDSALLLLNRWKEQNPKRAVQNNQTIQNPHIPPTEDQLLEEWFDFFTREYARLKQPDFFSLFRIMQSYIQTTLGHAESWKKSFRELYTLSFYMDLLMKIEKIPEHIQWKQYYYFQYADYQKSKQISIEGISSTINKMDSETLQKEAPQHLQALRDLLYRQLLSSRVSKSAHWLTIYRWIWSRLLREKGLMTEEMKRLDLQLRDEFLPTEQNDIILYARAHFDIATKHDEAARDRFEAVKDFQLQLIVPYFDTMLHYQEWERIEAWIDWLKPMLPHLNQLDLQSVVQLWLQVSEHQQNDLELLDTLFHLLPKSIRVYSDFLVHTKRYKQWVDLQLLRKRSPYELDREILKEIDQHDRQALLPLYHQAIERSISEKNRNSYKTAVRHLKKLRALYKKMKLTDRFEDYLETLSQKYTRLRALQEELQKGKLFS